MERFVATQLMQVLQPASLELSVAAEQVLRAERERLEAHRHQRLERARYQAQRAARQHKAVEPENRLVARELERRWEEVLVTSNTCKRSIRASDASVPQS